jgi:hypothetical protein
MRSRQGRGAILYLVRIGIRGGELEDGWARARAYGFQPQLVHRGQSLQ